MIWNFDQKERIIWHRYPLKLEEKDGNAQLEYIMQTSSFLLVTFCSLRVSGKITRPCFLCGNTPHFSSPTKVSFLNLNLWPLCHQSLSLNITSNMISISVLVLRQESPCFDLWQFQRDWTPKKEKEKEKNPSCWILLMMLFLFLFVVVFILYIIIFCSCIVVVLVVIVHMIFAACSAIYQTSYVLYY